MSGAGISVVICCYNSAARLPQTLKHLALQKVPDKINWEIILVNNASTDDTKQVAKNEWLNYSALAISFKIVDEPKPGLSNARDKGIKTAEFKYIVFCDDDNWLNEDYLNNAYQIIDLNPQIGALGGQSTAASSVAFPEWFEASKKNYAVGKQADCSGDVTFKKFLWGSGIVFRKDIYNKAFLNFPSLLPGRKGKELTSGEDSEMCQRFILMGYKLFYTEDLKFIHFIPAERLTTDYNEKLVAGFVNAYAILYIYTRLIDLKSLPFKQKYIPLIKSILRVIIANITPVKRWNTDAEKFNIYINSGFKFKNINEDIIKVKQFSIKSAYL